MIETGWKVVYDAGGRGEEFYSVVNSTDVRYRLDLWAVRPKNCGPLCVFATRSQAFDFIRKNERKWWSRAARVFFCEYEPANGRYVWDTVNTVYSGERQGLETLPEGTRLAKRVRLLTRAERLVDHREIATL